MIWLTALYSAIKALADMPNGRYVKFSHKQQRRSFVGRNSNPKLQFSAVRDIVEDGASWAPQKISIPDRYL